jgi:DNA repair photolyase
MVAPVIPALNDHEIERILEAARCAGASTAAHVLLRLPLEVKDLFTAWLDEHAPGKRARVLSRVREMRGGRLNDPEFHSRFEGRGEYAAAIRQRFDIAAKRLAYRDSRDLDTSRFRPPPRDTRQLSLGL